MRIAVDTIHFALLVTAAILAFMDVNVGWPVALVGANQLLQWISFRAHQSATEEFMLHVGAIDFYKAPPDGGEP
jgi:hypothetical protein